MSNDVYLYLWGETMKPDEFFAETKKLVSANFVEIVMDQCHSGGFADKFTQTGAVITTSCAYNETATSYRDKYGIFLINWLSAIRGKDVLNNADISNLVDINKDGYLDFSEAAIYAKDKVKTLSMSSQYTSNPGTLGQLMAIDEIKPEAYCNNGKQDNGETGVDCGGSCSNQCVNVINGSGTASCSCFDGIKNQNETYIDCGGSCLPCNFDKKPVNVLSVSGCQCGNANLQSATTPTLFSGLNLLNTNNIKLSHGYFRHQFSYSYWLDEPSYAMNQWMSICGVSKTNWKTEESILNGGLIFEENNVQFVPYKKYVLKFNCWYNPTKGIQFSLANGLTNTFSNMETSYAKFANEYIHSHTYYTYKSSTNNLPQLSNIFNIGQVGQITPPDVCHDNIDVNNYNSYVNYPRRPYFADYGYAEVSLIFTPDDYYKQLWIVGDNIFFNSLKIEEFCITDLVYNEDNTKDVVRRLNDGTYVLESLLSGEARNVANPSKVSNLIVFDNFVFRPRSLYSFISGKSVVLKNNTVLSSQNGGSVHISIDNNVCSGSSISSNYQSVKRLDENPSQSVIPLNYTNSMIKLYPNPTDGLIYIDNHSMETYTVTIYDFSGKIVKEVPKCSGIIEISISDFPKGIYAFKISNASTLFVEKVIKK